MFSVLAGLDALSSIAVVFGVASFLTSAEIVRLALADSAVVGAVAALAASDASDIFGVSTSASAVSPGSPVEALMFDSIFERSLASASALDCTCA